MIRLQQITRLERCEQASRFRGTSVRRYVALVPEKCDTMDEWRERHAPKDGAPARENSMRKIWGLPCKT